MNFFAIVDKNTNEVISFVRTTDKKYNSGDKNVLVKKVEQDIRGQLHNYKLKDRTITKYRDIEAPSSTIYFRHKI